MKRSILLYLFLAAGIVFTGCDKDDDDVVELPDLAYAGSESCGASDCHETITADFLDSGHPYKFNIIEGNSAPTYPSFVTSDVTLPTGVSAWSDLAGVIGGYGWKARFVDKTGHVVGTAESEYNAGGGNNQWNFSGGEKNWSSYHPADVKKYNYGCFRCHTTGAVDTDNPDSSWLKMHLGVDDPNTEPLGYFEFGGIECERCHGMGNQHAVEGDPTLIERIARTDGDVTNLCGECHYRLKDHQIQVSGDFVRHHEQFDEFTHSAHYLDEGMDCTTCHDPHKRTRWSGDGITQTCTESCHTTVAVASPHNNYTSDCTTCHMAQVAKSAQSLGDYVGDVMGHSFAISTDTTWAFSVAAVSGGTDVTVMNTENGVAKMPLAYACYQCHTDAAGLGGGGSVKTLTELYNFAIAIHN